MKTLKILLGCLLLLFTHSLSAQDKLKVKQRKITATNPHINDKVVNSLNDLFLPVRQQLEEVIAKDKSGNFVKYKEAVEKLKKTDNPKEYEANIRQIQDEFYPYIKTIWEKAAIDEKKYRVAILNCFPEKLRDGIQFTEFLNFTVGPSQKPEPPAPDPAPAPAPSLKCVNVHDHMQGAFAVEGLIAGGVNVRIRPSENGSRAMAMVNAKSISTGAYLGQGWLFNNITIPGTFAADYKAVEYSTELSWFGNATAIAVLGGTSATIGWTTNALSEDYTDAGGEVFTAVAPVLFISSVIKTRTQIRVQLLQKSQMKELNFGASCFGQSKSFLIGSLSYGSSISDIGISPNNWRACEK